jgi:hypothetical protein
MLRGSLKDLAIVDLLQIPLGSGKTGELLIATEEEDARLYYVEGSLVHLVSGDLRGRQVLDLIVGWTDGEFEFRSNVLSGESSFGGDLSPELRSAVYRFNTKRRDRDVVDRVNDRVRHLLHDFLTENDFAIHACLMHPDGTMDVCGAERTDIPSWLEKIRMMMLEVAVTYPRRRLHRMLFEDDDGTLVATCYPEDHSVLLVAAKRGATLGAVSIGVDRLARKIEGVKER